MPDNWTLTFKNLVLPIFCKACSAALLTEENGYFCATCWELSPRTTRPFCPCCGRPHMMMVGFGHQGNFVCADCRERPNRHVRATYAPALYEEAVETAVKLLKFSDKPRVARPLGEMLAGYARQEMDCAAYHALVPVPLHRVRARSRGFNQSLLLAEQALAAFPNARLDTQLARIRPTRTQSKLKGLARRANVRGAFAAPSGAYEGESVVLVDDVVTTAGTATECARALRRAGAAHVDVLAVAVATVHVDGA